jgi:hypothetical protein
MDGSFQMRQRENCNTSVLTSTRVTGSNRGWQRPVNPKSEAPPFGLPSAKLAVVLDARNMVQ